jgi:hypothetical protein
MALSQKYSDLTKAVIHQFGSESDFLESAQDIADHGADAGWSGFTYYHDTMRFYDLCEEIIWDALDKDADAFGESILQFIAGFRDAHQITDLDTFKNMLAWYALETAAQEIVSIEFGVSLALGRGMATFKGETNDDL